MSRPEEEEEEKHRTLPTERPNPLAQLKEEQNAAKKKDLMGLVGFLLSYLFTPHAAVTVESDSGVHTSHNRFTFLFFSHFFVLISLCTGFPGSFWFIPSLRPVESPSQAFRKEEAKWRPSPSRRSVTSVWLNKPLTFSLFVSLLLLWSFNVAVTCDHL